MILSYFFTTQDIFWPKVENEKNLKDSEGGIQKSKRFRGGHTKITLKVLPHNLSSYLSNQKYTVPKIRCRILFTSALNREVSSLPRRNITAEHFNYKLKTCQHVYGIEKVSFIQKEFDNFLLTVLR